jgi:hypothetical protein
MAAAEQKKSYEVFKNFRGVNTKANRTAIGDDEFYWLENAMPIGYGNLKTTPTYDNVGSVTFSNNVVNYFSANIGTTDYLIAFQDDGSCEYVNLTTNTQGTLAAAGTFTTTGGINVSQWKNDRLLIIDPVKGYFTWNAINLIAVGSVGTIGIIKGGTGYTTAPTVTISAPNQTNGIQALAVATVSANAVTSVILTEAGSGYTSAPTITFSGSGTNANAVASTLTFAQGTVSVLVTNTGTGYTNVSNLVVTISGGGGGNAAGQAILLPITNSSNVVIGNVVSQVVMTNNGTGYTNQANITVSITGGGGNGATAKAIINTGNNSGIQSFSGRVWIANGRTIYYSAASSYNDFVTVSAGAVSLTDATLHGNIIQILSANNFLYIFGDDSINVFSDVRVTSYGTTLFTNTNVSASVGTKLPYAIFPYFRSVLFMNDYGIYALVGSTTSKISDPLDGIFTNIDFAASPSNGGQVLLNNILCAAFNFKYTGGLGTSTNDRYIQAVFFEKKWFFTSASETLKYVVSVPVGGRITLFGTDGRSCVKMYANSTAQLNSYVQTSLNPMKDPIRTKQALKVGVEATLSTGANINLTVDSESGSSDLITLPSTIQWINNYGATVPWVNDSSVEIPWTTGGTGYTLYKTDAKQYGKYLGMTVTSATQGIVYNGFEYEHELRTRF